ncbi:hypothetical protein JCM10908_000200 [Rhodotorula pacifica]|uniref:uncharacterized protein n=1 Tax=Rhodotorula pacifica TaxID=1495444 RepID=UPI00316FD2B9
MPQTATQRLNRASPAPAATAAPSLSPASVGEQRSQRRLSRISPSEFDSVLSNGDTVRIRSREPTPGAAKGQEDMMSASSAPREGTSRDLAAMHPSGNSNETSEARNEGMRGGVAQEKLLPAPPTSAAAPAKFVDGPLPDRTMQHTASNFLSDYETAHYDSLVTVGAIDSLRKPRSRHGSAAPESAPPVVNVSFPRQDAATGSSLPTPPMNHSNASTSTLAGAFGFSPRRRRVQSDDTIQERTGGTFAGTMRKTSRFFRRFGSGSAESEPSRNESSHTSAAPAAAVAPSSTASTTTSTNLPPPVPSLPPSYQDAVDSPARPSTPPPKPRPIPDVLLLRTPSPNRSPSAAVERTREAPQIFPSPSSHLQRSLSMNSLERLDTRTTTTTASETDASPASTRRQPPRSEDDRLRRELRKWRVAIDGVMDEDSEMATPDPGLGLGATLVPISTPESAISNPMSSPGLAASPFGSRSRSSERISPSVGAQSNPSNTSSLAEAPEIRLHTPVIAPEAETPRAPPGFTPPEPTTAPTPDALALDSIRPVLSPAEDPWPRESLQEFLERTDPTPSRSPSRGPSPSSDAEPIFRQDVSNRSKGNRASVVGLSSSASGSGPSTPRPSSRTAKTAELRALDALDESDLEAKAQEIAQQLWDGDESFVETRKAAEWLGSASRLSTTTMRHYMSKFDFAGLRLDGAFRRLCSRLYLKAETQQVDRILEHFSLRYYEQNPHSPYGSSDVVHAVTYSVLLLNTDLHVVDSTSRMTRQQFVRNTLEAVRAQTEAGETATPPGLLFGPDKVSAGPLTASPDLSSSSVFGDREAGSSRVSLDQSARTRRSMVDRFPEDSPSSSSLNLPSSPAMSRSATTISARALDSPARTSLRSESAVTLGSTLSHRRLEPSLQGVLKDMYAAVKAHPIYQLSGESGSALNLPEAGRSSISLVPTSSPYATWSPNLQRRTSHRSSHSTISGVATSNAHKRASVRGLGALLGASSLELVRSASPTPSSTTSLSDDHWGLASGGAAMLQQGPTNSIGFASNLAHTIIKEQQEDDARSEASLVEITDEELALLGAPWAKEGLLERKHFWEATGKRSKDKNWTQAFVVVSAGQLRMFRFGAQGGAGAGGSGAIGGGDWTTTASSLGSLSLVHALTSTVPPPGYSRARPHCFIFTLPDGGSFFFQAGTPDLVAEWVATCNYWSARLSREPLAGGVSNMEYGWNRVDEAALEIDDNRAERASIRSGHSRRSFASTAFRHAMPLTDNDRVHINDWTPPQTPLAPSQLSEDNQLEALKRHLGVLQKETTLHDALKGPMTRLYTSRSSNAVKALANWTRKSQHLQSERVKYQTYVEALSSAIKLRALHNGKKEVERMLKNADEVEPEDELHTVGSRSPSVGVRADAFKTQSS